MNVLNLQCAAGGGGLSRLVKVKNASKENVGSRSESAGAYRDGYERAGKKEKQKNS